MSVSENLWWFDGAELTNFKNGVWQLSDLMTFEDSYLKARNLEGRVYGDQQVKALPFWQEDGDYAEEWRMRERTAIRFGNYVRGKAGLRMMDLGCGNGWFTNYISEQCDAKVVGVDINLEELEQAARIFPGEHLAFVYANILTAEFQEEAFDIIVMNACIQYFPNITELIARLFWLLKPHGEIHILDSPFYTAEEVDAAKERSRKYYTDLGVPEMADNYYHHSWTELEPFAPKQLYKHNKMISKVQRIFGSYTSPFPWLVIERP